uniref:Uncharacterized protein n=1 Tax=Raoultella ornithinolytica TaxID=54291 RepID=A0A7G9A895_RAOOR|nr:Hypothetical protein [Raoultella ornithinolytica]
MSKLHVNHNMIYNSCGYGVRQVFWIPDNTLIFKLNLEN